MAGRSSLAISTQCHFCKDSTPFYRKLQEQMGNVKTVAVLPQPVSEAEQYLSGEGVHVDQVKQAKMSGIGVSGTPTMLLVNSAGVVTKDMGWKGPTGAEAGSLDRPAERIKVC
jgi:hypothetical protein